MPMARLSEQGHKLLQELAHHQGISQQQLLDEALEAYKRKRFFEEANRAYAALREDPEQARSLAQEHRLLDGPVDDSVARG